MKVEQYMPQDGVTVSELVVRHLRRLLQTDVWISKLHLMDFMHLKFSQVLPETDMKCHDGWGTTYDPVDNNVSAGDVTSHAWDAAICDWSKPPKIKSVEQWDDTGAKEAWDRLVAAGRSPVNVDPDLYVERNIDWNARIPAHLLAFVDSSRYRHRKPRPRPRSPVVLGLETSLVHNSCGDHTQPPIIRCELECGSWRM